AAAALHLRTGQDRAAPHYRSVLQEAARTGARHQARPRDGAIALRSRLGTPGPGQTVSRGLLLAFIGGLASAILSIGSFGPAPVLAVGFHLGTNLASIAAATAAMIVL